MTNGSIVSIIVVAVVIVVATIFGYYSLNSSDVNPKIQITPSSHDFGVIPKEAVSHTFNVKNIGQSTLEIKKISTSCACTNATIDSERIAPGQSTNMLVIFDPNIMAEIEENVFRIVYVKSNDPEQPEVEIEIRANVIGGKDV